MPRLKRPCADCGKPSTGARCLQCHEAYRLANRKVWAPKTLSGCIECGVSCRKELCRRCTYKKKMREQPKIETVAKVLKQAAPAISAPPAVSFPVKAVSRPAEPAPAIVAKTAPGTFKTLDDAIRAGKQARTIFDIYRLHRDAGSGYVFTAPSQPAANGTRILRLMRRNSGEWDEQLAQAAAYNGGVIHPRPPGKPASLSADRTMDRDEDDDIPTVMEAH